MKYYDVLWIIATVATAAYVLVRVVFWFIEQWCYIIFVIVQSIRYTVLSLVQYHRQRRAKQAKDAFKK